jgi:3-oxoacyl-[acyl-carrier protein] reductase
VHASSRRGRQSAPARFFGGRDTRARYQLSRTHDIEPRSEISGTGRKRLRAGRHAEAVAFDVTDRTATQAACERLLAQGAIQIVVNNAGVHDDAAFPALREAQWQRVIDVSLNGFFNVTQPLVMPMIRTRWGRIVNLSSVAAIAGNRGQVNYAAAKGALNSATKALALELASRGITVNAVAPGLIASGMAAQIDPAVIEKLVPMKRAGSAAEVAALVAFLASDEAGYISGQVVSINGAMI